MRSFGALRGRAARIGRHMPTAALAEAVLRRGRRTPNRRCASRLAERLAAADWAPHDLVAALALDEIEVAPPAPWRRVPSSWTPTFLSGARSRADVDHRVAKWRGARALSATAVADARLRGRRGAWC